MADATIAPKLGRRPKVTSEVKDAIDQAAGMGLNPKEIRLQVNRLALEEGWKKVSLRTVQRYMPKEIASSEVWRLTDNEPAEAKPVIEMLGYLMRATGGRIQQLSREEAALVARLHRLAPDLYMQIRWMFCSAYAARLQRREPTADLDAFLAFAPWRSDERLNAYERGRQQGWIWDPPFWLQPKRNDPEGARWKRGRDLAWRLKMLRTAEEITGRQQDRWFEEVDNDTTH